MTVRELVGQALERNGIRNVKQTARNTGVSYECLRTLLLHDHIPKDNTLVRIAEKLGMDRTELLLAAHRQRMSGVAADNLLTPAAARYRRRRVWPLSQEQCEYLGTVMSPAEIQLIRKYRQVSPEGRIQIRGYIDFLFVSRRGAVTARDVIGSHLPADAAPSCFAERDVPCAGRTT